MSSRCSEGVLVAGFGELSEGPTAKAGGKGASLSLMAAAGLPVPSGFVVCADAFRTFLSKYNGAKQIVDIASSLDVNDDAALEAASQRLQALILGNPIPESLDRAISDEYNKLGMDKFVAVRSSAVCEDGEAASFAGQQETFLNVTGAGQVTRYVQECWASFFSPRALFYRAQRGSIEDARMAVVVQEMVPADKSGVMFTVNPVTKNRNELVIESVYGLGEGIVSGMITPDNYVLDRTGGAVLREYVSMQIVAIVNHVGGGTHEVEVEPHKAGIRKLADSQLNELYQLGLRLEDLFGGPQDVEWCIHRDNIFVLQSRPITTL